MISVERQVARIVSEKHVVECFDNVVVDAVKGILTEHSYDRIDVYDIESIFKRLHGLEGVTITIEYQLPLESVVIQ